MKIENLQLEPMVVSRNSDDDECSPIRFALPVHFNGQQQKCTGSNTVIAETKLDFVQTDTSSYNKEYGLTTSLRSATCPKCGQVFTTFVSVLPNPVDGSSIS